MSSERKEFDEKPFEKTVDEGRANGEDRRDSRGIPGDGLAQRGDYR